MVEHVNIPWSIFSRFLFLGSEGEDTSLQLESRAWCEPWLQIRAPVVRENGRQEGLQGPSPVFLPEKLFGGSERAVTSENAPVERRELQVQPLPKPATAWWRNHHKPARNFLRRFNFEGSEDTVTSGKARKRLMVQLHQHRVRLPPSIPFARAVRAGLLHPN